MMHTLRCALLKGERARGMIPSFFETLESPAVEEYKHAQAVALANVIRGKSPAADPSPAPQAAEPPKEEKKVMDTGKKAVSFGEDDVVEMAPVEQGAKHTGPSISDTEIDRALMGQSMMFSNARLQALLNNDSDDDSDDDSDETGDVVAVPTAKVSKGLFGIKTKTATKSKTRMNMKKLGKSVRKMIIKD
jgi:hypothetical protein